jgi:hypothetical protein
VLRSGKQLLNLINNILTSPKSSGTITLTSELGSGSTFTLALPEG